MPNLITEQDAENFLVSILKGIGLLFYCLFLGFMELTKKIPLIVFAVAVGIFVSMSLCYLVFDLVEKRHALYSFALPVLVVLVLGAIRKQKQSYYEKRFLDAGFKGKDGRAPWFINLKKDADGKATIYFKSNIPLTVWKKNPELLQTALDCNILSMEQGHSKKIVKLITISTDYTLPTYAPWKDEYISPKDGVLIIGLTALKKVTFDLNKAAHVLSAGETGSGKSVVLRLMLWQLAKKGAVIFMMDFKGGVEFGIRYENYGEVVTEREKAVELLDLLVKENEARMAKFRAMEVKNLKEYNQITGEKLSRIGVFCDEIGEMLDKTGADKEEKEIIGQLSGKLSTLARLSRATGINLFLGVQRPDANVLTGQIKNNVPVRICGRFVEKSASEIVLGNTAASNLPDVRGRFMFKVGADTEEFQAFYFDDDTMLADVDNTECRVMTPALAKRVIGINNKTEPPPARATATPAKTKTIENIDELFIYEDEGEHCNDDNDSKIGKKRQGGKKAKSKASQSKTRKAS